jgi:hypothetical protein
LLNSGKRPKRKRQIQVSARTRSSLKQNCQKN